MTRLFAWLALPLLLWQTAVAEDDAAAGPIVRGLPAPVTRVLVGHGVAQDSLSLFVQEIGADRPLLATHANVARNPASTIKLLTTFAALDSLGPAYHWDTEVYALGRLREGRLEGDLLLKGYGDPWLVEERFWLLLRELRLRGLRDIAGDLVIDDSFFAPEPGDPGAFDGQRHRTYNVLPSALLVNFKSVRFFVAPDPESGGAHVRAAPAVDNLEIHNGLRISDRACRGYQRGVALRAEDKSGGAKVSLSGNFPARCREYSLTRAVMEDAPAFAYGVFAPLWKEAGGTLEGSWRRGLAPADMQPFYTFSSPSLAEVIRSINKFSSNVMTRQVLLTMGAAHAGPPGNHAKGIAAIDAWLAEKGLDFPELVLDNGAGLSRATRISARSMGRLLLAADASPFAAEFVSSLPISGMDGTLRRRFGRAGQAGMMHMKTGRLDHVYALAGYLRSRSGKDFVVVSLHNHQDIHRGPGEEAQNALINWLFAR